MRLESWKGFLRRRGREGWRELKTQVKQIVKGKKSKVLKCPATVQALLVFLMAATSSCFEGLSSIAGSVDAGVGCVYIALSETQLARKPKTWSMLTKLLLFSPLLDESHFDQVPLQFG